MKSFAIVTMAAVAAATTLPEGEFEFMRYVAEHNKSYATVEEYQHRLTQFMRIDAYIKKVNAPGSEYTHTAAHNKFSDFTKEEFSKLMTLKNVEDKMPKSTTPFTAPQKPVGANPNCDLNGCDYRKGSCVTPVKDQGQCGSCWAFSGTESVETAQCMVGNGLDVLSPQQLVDCSTSYGN
jgi:C1A family cysteine protease